ncbi:MAG TPA: sugar ABC transporter permease [Candidatus Limnocylindrales bacterium]|nr:sugar ABC transporter permease [Candidatus Limnocylindrales bacterium]
MTAATAPSPGRFRQLSTDLRREETRWAVLFLLPWIIGFVIFTAGPMIASLVFSFTNLGLRPSFDFVGTVNYERLLADPRVGLALANTAFFTVLHVPLAMGFALLLALMLLRVGRASGFFRTVFYLPTITPTVAIGALWLLLLNGQVGLINAFLGVFGIDGPNWTTDPEWIKPGLVLMSLWSLGSTVIIYFAALRNVPLDLYEAARVDGANAWQQFRNITVPMISGALFFTLIVNTIASLQTFDQVYTMYFGRSNATAGDRSALFYVVYLFNEAFTNFRMGYASALAWLLFIIIMIITFIQIRLSRRWVYYENE